MRNDVPTIIAMPGSDPVHGTVRCSPLRSLWWFAMAIGGVLAPFGAIGGVGWVLWGVCLRLVVSLTGRGLVGHFAHRQGPRSWHVAGASATAAVIGIIEKESS